MQTDEKNRRTYWILLAALLLLFLAGLILALIFFRMLPEAAARLRQGAQLALPPPPPAMPSAEQSRRALLELATRRRAGPLSLDGWQRKYGLRKPSAEPLPSGVVTSVEQQILAEPLPLRPAPPPPADEECGDYGGPFDLTAPGAALDFVWEPGRLCLRLHRPEVVVNQGQRVVYRPLGREVDACDLAPTESVCLDLPGLRADAGGLRAPAAGATDAGCDPETRLWRWHAGWPTNRLTAETVRRGAADTPPERRSIRSPALVHRYLGSDPAQWFSDMPATVRAEALDIYPGIDLACYADADRMEYVFVVWPGANPNDIRLAFDEAQNAEIDAAGNLVLHFQCGKIVHYPPRVYEVLDGVPVPLDGRYVLGPDNAFHFELGSRRERRPLRGGPVLDYLSYLGGYGRDRIAAVAVDQQGCAYVAGESTSARLPAGAREKAAFSSGTDVFVTKYRLSDSQPLYTAFIGGRGEDRALDLAVDPEGNVYVCGETASADFPAPTRGDALHPGAGWDAFLVRLDANGRLTPYGARWGGEGDERAYGVALDAATNVYLAGETSSRDFPATDAICAPLGSGPVDAFVAKFASGAGGLAFLTTFGGAGESSAYAVGVDDAGFVYAAGETTARDFPAERPAQPAFGGGLLDAFFVKLTPDGRRFVFASCLGGTGDDRALDLAVDVARNVYLAGETSSDNLRLANPVQSGHAGGAWDAFAAKFSGNDLQPVYLTYFGGSENDRAFAVAADAFGQAYLAGATASTNLPTLAPVQRDRGEELWEGFAAGIRPDGRALVYAAYLGAAGNDYLYGLAVDGTRRAHVGGATASTNLAVVRPLQDRHLGGELDGWVGAFLPERYPGPELRLVPAGGQPEGPDYDFYMARYETTVEEFVRFLNDAQANTNNWRGTNLFFDAQGNVWFNPAMRRESDEVFSIRESRIVYQPQFPIGSRYAVTPKVPPGGGSYSNHPVTCVSWYGAVKYCNWLTLETGRGAEQRCYREGTNAWDWAPVTCAATNWQRGLFTDAERRAWLDRKGFRLPMDHCETPPGLTNAYLTVSNEEFAQFLNDAERSPDTARGLNMHFDAAGNAWFHPARQPGRDEMFLIAASRLLYEPANVPGFRYSVSRRPGGIRYDRDPVRGVTWFGAMKYANWLTLQRGAGLNARAYREGADPAAWAPVTVAETNWVDCRFTREDWEQWLRLPGLRLPYRSAAVPEILTNDWPLGLSATGSWANAYNEFFKAGAWSGVSNVNYGFGRERCGVQDANYLDSGLPSWHDTTPVGFYDGRNQYRAWTTRTNANLYGIYDLSGNVEEWLTDPGRQGSLLDRACYGGSWMFMMPTLAQRMYVHPHFTDRFRGFRVVTTTAADRLYVVRIPYRICACGYGTGPGCGVAAAEREAARVPAEETVLEVERPGIGPGGLIYKPEEEVPIPVVPRPRPRPEKSPSLL